MIVLALLLLFIFMMVSTSFWFYSKPAVADQITDKLKEIGELGPQLLLDAMIPAEGQPRRVADRPNATIPNRVLRVTPSEQPSGQEQGTKRVGYYNYTDEKDRW